MDPSLSTLGCVETLVLTHVAEWASCMGTLRDLPSVSMLRASQGPAFCSWQQLWGLNCFHNAATEREMKGERKE